MGGVEDELQFHPTIPGEAYEAVPLDGKKEEVQFSRILCRIPTDPELSQNRLEGVETLRRPKMVCTLLPHYPSQNEPNLQENGEKEFRFHRVLRKNRESEPSGFRQQMVWDGVFDSEKFERSQREGRVTEAAWSPIGKRSKVFGKLNTEDKVSLSPGKKSVQTKDSTSGT